MLGSWPHATTHAEELGCLFESLRPLRWCHCCLCDERVKQPYYGVHAYVQAVLFTAATGQVGCIFSYRWGGCLAQG